MNRDHWQPSICNLNMVLSAFRSAAIRSMNTEARKQHTTLLGGFAAKDNKRVQPTELYCLVSYMQQDHPYAPYISSVCVCVLSKKDPIDHSKTEFHAQARKRLILPAFPRHKKRTSTWYPYRSSILCLYLQNDTSNDLRMRVCMG